MEEGEIKKGVNIYLYYWTIPVFLFFMLVNRIFPIIDTPLSNINLMISAVTFLFGFLITITFSLLLARSSVLKAALSDETGRLIGIFLLSKQLGKKFNEKISELIDKYVMVTLKHYTNYELSRDFDYGFYEATNLMEVKTKSQEAVANSYFYILGEFQPVRERLESITVSRIEWSIKFADYLLGSMLIILLFFNRGETFTNTIFVILSTTIIFIFLIIEDYDNLKIGDYTYNISNSEQLFDLIGKDRYYPVSIISRAKLETGKFYRIGFIDKKTGEEKIFSVKYNPMKFKMKLKRLISRTNSVPENL
jgi:hypothetical protein